MSGSQNEASSVLLGLAVNVKYSSFVAVRLPGAEIMTVCFIIAVDFVIQLQMTYQIVQLHNKVTNQAFENGGIEKTKIGHKAGTSRANGRHYTNSLCNWVCYGSLWPQWQHARL